MSTPDMKQAAIEINTKIKSLLTDISSLQEVQGIDVVYVSEALTCVRLTQRFTELAIQSISQ